MPNEVLLVSFSWACVVHNYVDVGYEYVHHQPIEPHDENLDEHDPFPFVSMVYDHHHEPQNGLSYHVYRGGHLPSDGCTPDASNLHLLVLQRVRLVIPPHELFYL